MKIFVWKSHSFALYTQGLIIATGDCVNTARFKARNGLITYNWDKFKQDETRLYLEDLDKDPVFVLDGLQGLAIYGSE